MSDIVKQILNKLENTGSEEKAKKLSYFFKTGAGQYGEGDKFFGVTVPEQRKIANGYIDKVTYDDLEVLIKDSHHEARLTALILLAMLFSTENGDYEAVEFYKKNIEYVNNWDLVDLSAPNIMGAYYYKRDRDYLFHLVESGDMWKQRIGIVSTFYFIKLFDFKDTLLMAEKLLTHKHDLIHKASGWMIREVTKRDFNVGYDFVKKRIYDMPRTMLRYAIEKYPEDLRQELLISSKKDR